MPRDTYTMGGKHAEGTECVQMLWDTNTIKNEKKNEKGLHFRMAHSKPLHHTTDAAACCTPCWVVMRRKSIKPQIPDTTSQACVC